MAELLDLDDGDALLRRVGRRRPHRRARPGRRLARGRPAAQRPPPRARPARRRRPRRPVARDVVEQDGELVLARTAIGPRPDPSLSLRVAAAAATHRLPIARATCEWLAALLPAAAHAVAAGGPVRAGHAARRRPRPGAHLGDLRPVRAGRRAGCRSGPGCAACRSTTRCTGSPSTGTWCRPPPRRPRYTREVDRPDLLLLGALLHDIGKGLPGDHSIVGAPIAAEIADPDRPAAGRRGDRREAGPAAPAAARRGHPARPGRPGDHLARSPRRSATPPRSTCCTRWPAPTRTPPARPPGRTGRAG